MPTDSKLKCRKVFVLPIEEFLRESTAEAQQQCVENNRYVYELFPVRSKVLINMLKVYNNLHPTLYKNTNHSINIQMLVK